MRDILSAGLSRRHVMAGLGGTALAGTMGSMARAKDLLNPPPSLTQLAQSTGRKFGSCIASSHLRHSGAIVQNPRYADLVLNECGIVVPENEMKWQAIRPDAQSFNFTEMDAIAQWAKANSIALRGHTLLWHRPKWFPEWLNNYDFGAQPASEAARLLTHHIETVMKRYGGQIHSWDVVNEAIDHDGHGILATSLSGAMGSGEDVLDLAFHTARQTAPEAQLVYNDYMSWEPQHEAHCNDVLRLLEGFRKRGTPVDALGIQSHIEIFEIDPATGTGPYREKGWRRFLDEVTGMGYKLIVTEFDVKDKALPSDIALRDQKVADFTRRYCDLMLSYPELGDFLAWGLVDKYSWLQGFAPRDDGLEVRCCPYDDDYQPKSMREALALAFEQAVPMA
ncbi:glycosyl hydrolase [Altererythrobacter indicus]|uniref:Beta-xylanase n=1 Tax=Altericroceibacterium indicum TaxID=374177 RepID=A0A845AA67_9SPHN|nr:endo-1,4-beta-xylanase [Altericroceibacterium indicum]MXP26249.1 glycosyl hydrolase [Altericroceibacterium indicum]